MYKAALYRFLISTPQILKLLITVWNVSPHVERMVCICPIFYLRFLTILFFVLLVFYLPIGIVRCILFVLKHEFVQLNSVQ